MTMKIYVTGPIGYETAERLYQENREALAARFPAFFLCDFEKLSEDQVKTKLFLDSFCIEKNTKNYYSSGIFKEAERSPSSPGDDRGEREACPEGDCGSRIYIREIEEGGLFAALWAACEDLERMNGGADRDAPVKESPAGKKKFSGCRVYLEKIPVDQHIVEILEYFKENPYEVSSHGSWLVIPISSVEGTPLKNRTESAEKTAGQAQAHFAGEDAASLSKSLTEIGEITEGKGRVVIYKEKQRFLTPPQRQAKDIAARKKQ